MDAALTLRGVTARAVIAPIARPVKTAVGTIPAAPLVLIDVATDQGVTGRAYIFGYTPLTLKPLVHLIEQIGGDLAGQPIAPVDLMAGLDRKFRLLGTQGLWAWRSPASTWRSGTRWDKPRNSRWPPCSAARRGR